MCSQHATGNMKVFVPLAHKLQKCKDKIYNFLGNLIVEKKTSVLNKTYANTVDNRITI